MPGTAEGYRYRSILKKLRQGKSLTEEERRFKDEYERKKYRLGENGQDNDWDGSFSSGSLDYNRYLGHGVLGVIARPGQGKTNFLRLLLLAWGNRGSVYLHDPMGYMRYDGLTYQIIEKPPSISDIPANSLVIIDEADRWDGEDADDLYRRARAGEVVVVWATQRPRGIPRSATACARMLLLGRQTEGADLDWVRDTCGDNALNAVVSLQDYQFVEWSPDGVTSPFTPPLAPSPSKKPRDAILEDKTAEDRGEEEDKSIPVTQVDSASVSVLIQFTDSLAKRIPPERRGLDETEKSLWRSTYRITLAHFGVTGLPWWMMMVISGITTFGTRVWSWWRWRKEKAKGDSLADATADTIEEIFTSQDTSLF